MFSMYTIYKYFIRIIFIKWSSKFLKIYKEKEIKLKRFDININKNKNGNINIFIY